VALLYAPQSGEETRAQIKEKSIEIRDQASEQAAAYRTQAEKQISGLRQKVDELQLKLSKEVKSAEESNPTAAA
jgi:gas vesicle protein